MYFSIKNHFESKRLEFLFYELQKLDKIHNTHVCFFYFLADNIYYLNNPASKIVSKKLFLLKIFCTVHKYMVKSELLPKQ